MCLDIYELLFPAVNTAIDVWVYLLLISIVVSISMYLNILIDNCCESKKVASATEVIALIVISSGCDQSFVAEKNEWGATTLVLM